MLDQLKSIVILPTLLVFCLAPLAQAETINVSVAISLRESLTQIAADYQKVSGDTVQLTFGSSGQLAAQIQNGAPVDLFISAALKQVEELKTAGLVVEGSQRIIARNELALIVPANSSLDIKDFTGLAEAGIKKVGIGHPDTVPAGQYASQVLSKLGIASKLSDRLIYGANVRQVLDYVSREEVSAGIVYNTDALEAGEKVKIIAKAAPELHDPIVYPAVILKPGKSQATASRFLEYLMQPTAQDILTSRGFISGVEKSPATADK